MSKIKGLLFDFNGTLFFDSQYHFDAFCACLDKYGLPRQSKEFIVKNIFGRTNGEIVNKHFKPNATEDDIKYFTNLKEGLYMDICRTSPKRPALVDGACEFLDYIKANNIPFCMATGSPLINVNFYFEELGIGRWFSFDNIVYDNGTFPGKPAPDIYLLAAQRLGLDPSECAVFEDGTSGLRAANAAGVGKTIAVWEKEYPSPITGDLRVDAKYHDFTDWKQMLSLIGLL